MNQSIRRRLLWMLSIALVLAASAMVVHQQKDVSVRMEDVADAHLSQSAHVLYSLVVSLFIYRGIRWRELPFVGRLLRKPSRATA